MVWTEQGAILAGDERVGFTFSGLSRKGREADFSAFRAEAEGLEGVAMKARAGAARARRQRNCMAGQLVG